MKEKPVAAEKRENALEDSSDVHAACLQFFEFRAGGAAVLLYEAYLLRGYGLEPSLRTQVVVNRLQRGPG